MATPASEGSAVAGAAEILRTQVNDPTFVRTNCEQAVEWAHGQLPQATESESLLEHITSCPDCLADAALAFVRHRIGSMRRELREAQLALNPVDNRAKPN